MGETAEALIASGAERGTARGHSLSLPHAAPDSATVSRRTSNRAASKSSSCRSPRRPGSPQPCCWQPGSPGGDGGNGRLQEPMSGRALAKEMPLRLIHGVVGSKNGSFFGLDGRNHGDRRVKRSFFG